MFNNYTSTYKLSFKSLENYNVIGIYGGKEDIHKINFTTDDLIELTKPNNIIIIDFNRRRNSRIRKTYIPKVINETTHGIGFRLKDNIDSYKLLRYGIDHSARVNIDINMIDILLKIDYEI